MPRPPTLLLVDPNPASRREIAEAFNQAGMVMRSVADPRQALMGAQTLKPDLVLVHSEVRGPTLSQTLDALAPDGQWATTPMVLLAQDASEARFLNGLRTGPIAILEKPFHPSHHVAELRSLLGELHRRPGSVSGQSDSKDLAQLVEHVRRTQRSGALTLNARTPEEGRALFVRGVLKEASHLGSTGVEALVAMVTSPRAAWSFAEVGVHKSEHVIDMPLATGEFPLASVELEPEEPVLLGEVLEGGPLSLEVGEVDSGEEEIPIEYTQRAPRPKAMAEPARVPILLVDDDEALCRMFSLLFRKHGFDVTTAPDGYAGYEAALSGKFELIVADLNMPRMDGWGMLRLLRDDFRTRELPVAFLSCHDDYRDSLRALDSGAQAYFSKSTRLDALATQVKALLEPRAQLQKALATQTNVETTPSRVGAQWLVREVARQGLSGLLDTRDGWAQYRITFRNGRPVHALAQAGRHAAEGQKAFVAFVASRGAEGHFVRGDFPVGENLTASAEELVDAAARVLNENETKVREGLLVHANHIQVNPDLYALYAQVGPPQWLPTARMICEEKLAPREVIARVDASPVDVEETMKDLLRRGVVTLTA